MNKRLLHGSVLLLGALAFGASLLARADNPNRVRIDHPGKYELVYAMLPPAHMNGYDQAFVAGREFFIPHSVVGPSVQSMYLLSNWEVKPGETVLDIGTGSGVQAIFAADTAAHVVATDLSADATKGAWENVQRHGLEDKIEVRTGDLFGPLKQDERFNVILFNIDYPTSEENQGLWAVHERFFAEVGKHLEPGGRIYYQAGLIDNIPRIKAMVDKHQLRITSMRMDVAVTAEREPIVFTIYRQADMYKLREAQAERRY